MPIQSFAGYSLLKIDGTQEYIYGVTACLLVIRRTKDGRALLDKLNGTGFTVTIKDTTSGNSSSPKVEASGVPKLCRAIRENNDHLFATELRLALQKASSYGITVDHYARQLANGLTPTSYTGLDNVARPTSKLQAVSPGTKISLFGGLTQAQRNAKAAKETIKQADQETQKLKGWLEGFADGTYTLNQLPPGWSYEVPRLLRSYLTPGPGTESTVSFNPQATFHCTGDPAMHRRPPAIGLAHELIHALHAAQGVDMWWVEKNGHHLEELITTGMAPYQFEELSDNKMRTQWPTDIAVRQNYTTLAGTKKVKV